MTITNSLIAGLTDKMVQARVNSIDTSSFYFGKFFPVKRKNGFSWKMLQDQIAQRNVAADIHTDNSSIVRKARPRFEIASGDIPHIAISRELTRSELKEYQTARAFAPDSSALELVDHWGGDVDFCFNGVQAELEYIAWALLSNACKLDFTASNNATFATQFSLDYQVDDDKKLQTSGSWADKKHSIIDDLVKIMQSAKKLKVTPKFGFLSVEDFYQLASNEEIIKKCGSLQGALLGVNSTPDLAAVNAMLAKEAWLNGLQLRVIDQTITRELHDSVKSENPFLQNRLVLSPTEILGETQYDILQENNPQIIRTERAHTVIKKYGQAEPTSEVTIGEADAMPVVHTAYSNLYVKTDGNSW